MFFILEAVVAIFFIVETVIVIRNAVLLQKMVTSNLEFVTTLIRANERLVSSNTGLQDAAIELQKQLDILKTFHKIKQRRGGS